MSTTRITRVIVTSLVIHHRRQEQKGEENECPDHRVQNVNIGDDAEAKLSQRVLFGSLSVHLSLGGTALALHNLTTANIDCAIGIFAVKQIVHFHRSISVDSLNVLHLGDASQDPTERFQYRVDLPQWCLCDGVQLFEHFQRIVDLLAVKRIQMGLLLCHSGFKLL